jgi:predicted outer membrane repeat protein
MKKTLLLSLFSVALFSLSIAQTLQYTKWKKFDASFNDTVIMNFRAGTFILSSHTGSILVNGLYTENHDTITLEDLYVGNCLSIIGTYKFSIDNNILHFNLISDLCTERVTVMNGSYWNRMPGIRINVPADYTTIQAAIEAANNCDTVLVSENTYYEQISFLGKKPLIVASEYLLDGDTSHISNTIIDGSQLTNMDSASVVYFTSGEDTTSILCGFTVQHGKGTYLVNTWKDRDGGGIWISGSGAKIIHNRITDNIVDDTQPVNGKNCYGAGICTDYEDADYWLVIENNVIDHNKLISKNDGVSGAGIYTICNSRIAYNTISDNSSLTTVNGSAYSAGIAFGADTSWVSDPTFKIHHNIIKNNHAQGLSATGGGVNGGGCKIDFSYNEVIDNQSTGTASYGGIGGFGINTPQEGSRITNNKFQGNSSYRWSGGLHIETATNDPAPNMVLVENNYFIDNDALFGGALTSLYVPVLMQNNVFSNNHSGWGGACYLSGSFNSPAEHFATIINNSFSGNKVINHGGAIYATNAKPLIINSIFWGDSAANGREIFLNYYKDTLEIAYSTINPAYIFGNVIQGGGNLNEEPMFTDSVLLTLSPSSYCINTGTLAFTCNCGETHNCPGYDIAGLIRPQGPMADMGAYEILFVGKEDIKAASESILINYPNPFNSSTTFIYTLAESSRVTLYVYDSYGKLVAELINAFQQKGEQRVEWNGDNLPSGIYYCRLQAGAKITACRIIISR